MKAWIARAERALRWSERYMKTDMVYAAKGGFWLSLGQIVSSLAGLVLIVGFANLVPKEVYGTYRLVLSIAGVIAALTLSGLDVAVTQAVARGDEGALRTGTRALLRWSFLMPVASLAAAAWYASHGNRLLATCLLIVAVASPIIESTSLYAAFLNGKKDFRAVARYGAVKSLAPTIAMLLAMLLTREIVPLVLVYFLAHAATNGFLYLAVLRRYRPPVTDDGGLVGYGAHVSLTNVVSIVVSYLDKILVFHFLGAVQLAAYGIAFSLPAQLKVVTKMVTALAFPKMSAASLASLRSAIWQKAFRLFLGYAAAVAFYIAVAPLVFRLIFPQYLEAVRFSQVLALGYLFSPVSLFSQAFFAQKRHKEIYINKIGSAAARIVLLLLLLPLYGLWGAVWAYVLGNAVSFAITMILFHRLKE